MPSPDLVATTPTLLSLPHELIVEILSHCSVETVLRVESTCKTLHSTCQSRAIWKSCIERLDIEYAPSLNPFLPLQAIQTPELRRIVTSAIRRHDNWRTPQRIHNLRVVDLHMNRAPDDQDIIVEPRLLPGGKEVLVLNCGRIELWSLETKERLWELRSPIGRSSCVGFDLDVVDNGNVLIIATLFEDFEMTTASPLSIYSFDIGNKTESILFERILPPVFLFRMMLRGDYFIACIPRSFQTIVINWRTGQALTLGFNDSMGNRIDPHSTILADNELVSFVNLDEAGFSAIRLPISTLSRHWSKAMDYAFWTHVSICPYKDGTSVLPLPYPGQQERVINRNDGSGPWIIAHRVFEPTWKPNAPTEIFLAAYDCGPGGQTPTRLVSFRLQLSQQSPSTTTSGSTMKSELKLIACACAQSSQLPWNSRSLSNSGRMFSLRSKMRCFSLFTDNVQPMGEVTLGKEIVPCADDIEPVISAVEPWSEAIAIGMPGVVKVVSFV